MIIKKTAIAIAMVCTLSACDDGDDGAPGAAGTPGAQGASGLNSLIDQIQLATGDSNCPNGGLQVNSGLDDDSDGTLSDAEVDETTFQCNEPVTTTDSAAVAAAFINNQFSPWYSESDQKVSQNARAAIDANQVMGAAKNIILFVGDGMGPSTVTGARIFEGQAMGLDGEEHELSFETMPFVGLSKVYNVDAQTPDSAGTMTAMMSGVKTDVGVIGVDEDIVRGDCSTVSGNEVLGALHLAELAGKSTGVVATARLTHATPAATYAHSADRNYEDVSDLPSGTDEFAAECAGAEDIASQLISFESRLEARFPGVDVDGIEVAMGGGRRHFIPNDAAFNVEDVAPDVEGDRTDGRDLPSEWQAMYPQGAYVVDQAGFDSLTGNEERVLGLFNESHMQYEGDRANDRAGEPSLTEMVEKSIQILDNNEKGFFLMVESGRIDHAHHAGNAWGAFTDTSEFAEAIQAAMNNTSEEDTLIIVTADHSHVMTIGGYAKRGNPILGKVVQVGSTEPHLAADDLPYTTLAYANGNGFHDLGTETNSDASYGEAIHLTGRVDLTSVDTTSPGFHQEALIPLSSETHSGEDVGVYASGPGASFVRGTNEQNVIFHVMNRAGALESKADAVVD